MGSDQQKEVAPVKPAERAEWKRPEWHVLDAREAEASSGSGGDNYGLS